MKRSVILLLCLLSMLSFPISCKKETIRTDDGIEGVWDLRKVSGSWATLTYQPGSGNNISFTGSHYEIMENSQVTEAGEYEIAADPTVSESTCLNIEAGQYTQRLIFNNARYPQKVFFELLGNKLTLLSGCVAVDAGSRREYERQ